MARRSREDTAATRGTIVASAVDIASTSGLEGLTIGRLADSVGMSKSGVVGHFGSKEQLQLAALDAATARFTEEVWRPVADEQPGIERLRATCESWLSYLQRGVFPGGCFLSAASLEFDDRPGPVRDRVAETMRRWLAVLEADAATAQEDGDLTTSVSARQIAHELNGVFLGTNWAHRLLRSDECFATARVAIGRVLGG